MNKQNNFIQKFKDSIGQWKECTVTRTELLKNQKMDFIIFVLYYYSL